jgi:hypothetical protein
VSERCRNKNSKKNSKRGLTYGQPYDNIRPAPYERVNKKMEETTMTMAKTFIARVLEERIVDTRNYRYVVKECYNHEECWQEIRRLPIITLDTTSAIDWWETVWTSKEA